MALNLRKFLEGLRIIPKASTSIDSAGEMEVLTSDNKLQYHNGTSKSPVVTEAHSATLTNKTLTSPVLNTPTADTITGIAGGALTVQSASNQNLSLQAQGTGVVSLESLSVSGNTVTGDTASTLTITTANNQNLTLTANGTGVVNATRPLKLSTILIEDSAADTTTGSSATLATPTRSVVRLTAAGTLTSVDMIPAGSDGQRLTLINTTGASVSVNDNTGATAANRIRTGTGAAITLAANASIELVYNGTTSYWMIIGGTGSGGGGSSNTVIDALASTEATLTSAISSLSSTGGIIGISASFSVSSAVSIPNGIILVGHGINIPTITFAVGGSFTLGTQSQIRDLNFGASKTSGTLLTMSGDKVTIDKVRFSVTSTNALTCIQVTGSANLIFRTIFFGVVGATAVGIDYAGGISNNDSYCIFE